MTRRDREAPTPAAWRIEAVAIGVATVAVLGVVAWSIVASLAG